MHSCVLPGSGERQCYVILFRRPRGDEDLACNLDIALALLPCASRPRHWTQRWWCSSPNLDILEGHLAKGQGSNQIHWQGRCVYLLPRLSQVNSGRTPRFCLGSGSAGLQSRLQCPTHA